MSEEPSNLLDDWANRSLANLIEHIVRNHHSFCRTEGISISSLMKEALRSDQRNHPELTRIQMLFFKMSKDLSMHLLKEEETLFPYIIQVENARDRSTTISWPPFGTVENPIRMMILEHDQTSEELHEIRKLSNGYTPPANASQHLVNLYSAMAVFDKDMVLHINLENLVLFPRAVAMEEQVCTRK